MAIDLEKMPKLGFGMMRLPQKDGAIDIGHVCRMADAYLEAGMNYFDTAYVYHGGNSEKAVKEALAKRHPRDSFMVATKLPAWCLKTEADRDRIFNEQLERCGLDYFDFYLLHSIEDGSNGDTYERLNCFSWGLQKKAEGKIRHFGFSFHGSPEYLIRILDKHPEVEFVQIQLNYADWNNPVVCSGRLYEILHERNIPMVIMEPVKGGSLASLRPELEANTRRNGRKSRLPPGRCAMWAPCRCDDHSFRHEHRRPDAGQHQHVPQFRTAERKREDAGGGSAHGNAERPADRMYRMPLLYGWMPDADLHPGRVPGGQYDAFI